MHRKSNRWRSNTRGQDGSNMTTPDSSTNGDKVGSRVSSQPPPISRQQQQQQQEPRPQHHQHQQLHQPQQEQPQEQPEGQEHYLEEAEQAQADDGTEENKVPQQQMSTQYLNMSPAYQMHMNLNASATMQYYNPAAYARFQAQMMAAYQSQVAVSMPSPVFSLDVECVATGPKHNDRTPAQVSLVDQWERVLLNFYIKPKNKVFSYMSGLTGLDEDLLKKGVDIDAAMYMIRTVLPSNATLVGQNILQDVNWLQLEEGKDYAGLQDLSGLWRAYNEQYNSFTYFSLHHEAKALLGIVQEPPHNACTDAILSIRLYNLYKRIEDDPEEIKRAHNALLKSPVDASFAKTNPVFEGVCMGNKKTCKCGDVFFF